VQRAAAEQEHRENASADDDAAGVVYFDAKSGEI
jgi:hypothetical protein